MDVQELTVTAADGHAFALRLARPAAPRARLLWVPALGVPAAKYDGFGLALAARGVAVATLEWRGIGTSSWRASRGRDWGYRELLDLDLCAARAALPGEAAWAYGGHSLGAQFAAMLAADTPAACARLVLLATGVPHAAAFRGRQRLGVSLFAASLGPLTRLCGHYPGDRLGFAGREAGGVMRDWAATVRSGCYAAYGAAEAREARLRRLQVPVLALRFSRDWLVPEASLEALLAKLGPGAVTREVFDDARLGVRADHFRWMRAPDAPAAAIASWLAG